MCVCVCVCVCLCVVCVGGGHVPVGAYVGVVTSVSEVKIMPGRQ